MDTKYKDDLFRKYVQYHESKVDVSDNKQHISDDYLRTAASALLSLTKIDPGYRFRLIKFYEMAEKSLKTIKTSNLHSLYDAVETLETVGINLFLYPWKKEFKMIKTYTGPFVYNVRSTLPEEDIKQILKQMGYDQESGNGYRLKELVDTTQVKRVSFELFLARVECELLLEIHSQVKEKGYSEIDVINERKKSNEDVRGCSDEMKRRVECKETLNTSMARMVLQKSASERAASKDYFKPKVTKPSKSVDTYDSYLERKNKPPLMTTLSLRKEPVVAALDDIKDEIIRPSPSLLTMSSSPHGCSDDFLHVSSHPNGVLRTATAYNSYLSAQDDVDLYTDPDSRVVNFKRPESVKPDVWLIKNEITPTYHKRTHLAKETISAQCQNCGASCSTTVCQNCDSVLIYRPDYPAVKQSGFPAKTAMQNDALSPASALREKSLYVLQTPNQDRVSQHSTKLKPVSSVRCSFCNRPGASNTCLVCSKVSCDDCVGFYYRDYCCRKSEHHKFTPNNQINYKSTQLSHLVYR